MTDAHTTQRTLPLAGIGYYPRFLTEHSTEPGLLLADSLAELTDLRPLEAFTPEHRAKLVDALLPDLQKWEAPAAALSAAELLRSEHVYAVVTGQQAGIATGPLYTLYKALGAVRAAETLRSLHPEHEFVPVFWIEADDHDFDEVRSLTVLNRAGEPAKLSYDDGDPRPLPVGDRGNNVESIASLMGALRDTFLSTEFTDDALAILELAYGDQNDTLADGFARAFYRILEDTPLVLVNSRSRRLKRLAADVFALEATDPGPLHQAIEKRTAELAGSGRPLPITPKRGAIFIVHERERRMLDPEEGGYRVRGTDLHLSTKEVVRIAREETEKLSPNVVLRPIVQDTILPTALYLGGPNEVAYLSQVRAGYEVFGMSPPAIAPRPFALLLEPKVARVLDGAGLTLETLLDTDFDPAAHAVDSELDDEIGRIESRVLDEVAAAYRQLEEITGRIDPTLEKTLGAAGASAQKGIEDFAKRLHAALRKKNRSEIDRLEGARSLLLPGGQLQERTLSPLYYINKYGLDRFRAALANIGSTPGVVQVVEM